MTRRILSAVIVLCTAMILVACGQDRAPAETPDAASEAAPSPMEQAEAVRDRAEKEAKEMIDQVKSFLAEDRQEMARTLMDKLASMANSLSAEFRAEIERLDAMFSEA